VVFGRIYHLWRVITVFLLLATGSAAPVAAQAPGCQQAQAVAVVDNVDLLLRYPAGGVGQIRLAGLQVWPDGWPLADQIPDQVVSMVRRQPLCLSVDGLDRAPDGVALRQVVLPAGRGDLGAALARAGLAQVAADAETTAPASAVALRAAEAEARDARRGIWQVLSRLAAYRAPGGGTFTVDIRLAPAFDVLAQMDIGRPLVDALARGGVTLFALAEADGIWAHYDTVAQVIGIDSSLLGSDARTIATLLSHEATHAQDFLEGTVDRDTQRLGSGRACFADEYRASLTELQVWQQLYGPTGMASPLHPYERQENRDLVRYLQSPDRYAARLASQYAGECAR
jgi:endonuclease YncB( thermonuclease family)